MSGPVTAKAQRASRQQATQRSVPREHQSASEPGAAHHPIQTLSQPTPPAGAANKARAIRALQRTIGNRATNQLAQRQANEPLQAKLTVGPPGDMYEREADSAADRVAAGKPVERLSRLPAGGLAQDARRQPEAEEEEQTVQASGAEPNVQRLCSTCEEEAQRQADEEETPVRAKAGGGPELDTAAAENAMARSGSGNPLDPEIQGQMEDSFGADFSAVRVHTGPAAQEASRVINAHSFTLGYDIYFAPGQYNTSSSAGKRLLAHELAHVLQQTSNEPAHSAQTLSVPSPRVQRDFADLGRISSSDVSIDGDTSNINELVDRFLQHPDASASARVQRLVEMRDRYLAHEGPLSFSEQQIAAFRRIEDRLRAVLPAWVDAPPLNWVNSRPLENDNNPPEVVQRAAPALVLAGGGATVSLSPLIIAGLIILLILVVVLIILYLDSERHRAELEEADRMTDRIAESDPSEAPGPGEDPAPRPWPRPRPPPGPEGLEEPEEDEESRCQHEHVRHAGGNARHDQFAESVTGSATDFLITAPDGQQCQTDGLDQLGSGLNVVWEVKTRHEWATDSGMAYAPYIPSFAGRIGQIEEQRARCLGVTTECGYEYRYAFDTDAVACSMRQHWMNLPSVYYRVFPGETRANCNPVTCEYEI